MGNQSKPRKGEKIQSCTATGALLLSQAASPRKPQTISFQVRSTVQKPKENFEKEAQTWKEKGNQALGAKKYVEAIDYYTQGLAHPSTVKGILLANRSLAFLKLSKWQVLLLCICFAWFCC